MSALRLFVTVAVLLLTMAHARAAEVVTAIVDVRACVPLDDGRVLAASAGGLGVVAPNDTVERALTSVDGLPDTRVNALLVEGDVAWVGTDRGVAEVALSPQLVVRRTFVTPPVRALARHDGVLYAGTWGDGIHRVLPSGASRVSKRALRVTSLASFGGELYAGTEGEGLVRGLDTAPVVGSPHTVAALAVLADRLEVASVEGIDAIDRRGTSRRLTSLDVRALAVRGDTLLAGTLGAGLTRFGAPPSRELGDAPLVQAAGARLGVTCAASPTELYVARGGALHAVNRGGLASNDVSALAGDDARVFVGTFDRGLFVVSIGAAESVRAVPVQDASIDRRINALALDAGGALWIATARGLARREGDRPARRFTTADGLPSDEVHAVVALPRGGVVVGTSRGAALVEGDAVVALGEKEGLHACAVWALAILDDALFVGTSHGLWVGRGRGASRTWRRLSVAEGTLAEDWVTALAVHGSDLFVGTYSHGVRRLVDARALQPRTEDLGGGYVNLGGLLAVASDDRLFAATMDGLLVRPIGASGATSWSPVGSLPGRNVTALAARGTHAVWAGTRSGLAIAK